MKIEIDITTEEVINILKGIRVNPKPSVKSNIEKPIGSKAKKVTNNFHSSEPWTTRQEVWVSNLNQANIRNKDVEAFNKIFGTNRTRSSLDSKNRRMLEKKS